MVSRRGQLWRGRFPQFYCFWKIFKHPISRQLKQRSKWRKEAENNRLEGDGEREDWMVGDTDWNAAVVLITDGGIGFLNI